MNATPSPEVKWSAATRAQMEALIRTIKIFGPGELYGNIDVDGTNYVINIIKAPAEVQIPLSPKVEAEAKVEKSDDQKAWEELNSILDLSFIDDAKAKRGVDLAAALLRRSSPIPGVSDAAFTRIVRALMYYFNGMIDDRA